MKPSHFAILPIALMVTLLTSCIEDIQLCRSNDKKHIVKKPVMADYNTGIQSSMEAGSYWAARSIIAAKNRPDNQTQKENPKSNLAFCGLFTLFSTKKFRE